MGKAGKFSLEKDLFADSIVFILQKQFGCSKILHKKNIRFLEELDLLTISRDKLG